MGPGFVYSLRTISDGFYPHLKDGYLIYMKANEVWKYGETYNPEGHYTNTYLRANNLTMILEAPATNAFNAKLFEQSLLLFHTMRYGDLPPGNKIMR